MTTLRFVLPLALLSVLLCAPAQKKEAAPDPLEAYASRDVNCQEPALDDAGQPYCATCAAGFDYSDTNSICETADSGICANQPGTKVTSYADGNGVIHYYCAN